MTANLRLVLPQWQGGVNPNYWLGSAILAALVPTSQQTPTVTIPVATDFDGALATVDHVDKAGALQQQLIATQQVLAARQPRRVITLGGDCSISAAPFDYLSGQYGDDFGVVWLDAHPDVATNQLSTHFHEMVLASLLHHGAPAFDELLSHPVAPAKTLLAGLIAAELRPVDQQVNTLKLAHLTPEDLVQRPKKLTAWLQQNRVKHVAVHWDLDVLSPQDFHSILPAEPGLDLTKFGAAIGTMTLAAVTQFLKQVSQQSDLVGLSIAEHMPWDALRLRQTLQQLTIFD